MTTIDFAVIGGQKCGSTSIHSALEQHPQVVMQSTETPVFEDPFYSPENMRRFDSFVGRVEQPDSLFGIKRPDLLCDQDAPARLREHSPEVRLVAAVRDPASRLFSAVAHYMWMGIIPVEEPRECARRLVLTDPTRLSDAERELLEFGRYGRGLERWLGHFNLDQFYVVESAQLGDNSTWTGLADFLGVTPGPLASAALERVNVGVYDTRRLRLLRLRGATGPSWRNTTRWSSRSRHWRRFWSKPIGVGVELFDRLYASRRWLDRNALSERDRLLIHEYYREDAERLARVLGRAPTWAG